MQYGAYKCRYKIQPKFLTSLARVIINGMKKGEEKRLLKGESQREKRLKGGGEG